MATCDSDFSSDAPADFHLSSSTEDSCTRLSPTFEKCPLCSNQRKVFYCRQCIQNGDFVRSVRHYSTRYAEKHMQLIQRRKERREIEQRCRNILLKRLQVNKLQCELLAYRERVRLLKLLIQETKENISIAESKVTNLQEANAHRSDRLPRYEERICKLERYVVQMGMDAEKRRANMHLLHEELKNVIRTNVHQLVQYIFPIAQAQPVARVPPCVKSESPENEEKSTGVAIWSGGIKAEGATWHGLPVIREAETEPLDTVSALADATRTAYIRGHWVFTDSSGELQHCIVAPWLPDSGDYSAYNMWVAANKDGVPGAGGDFEVHNPAYNISAALTYTTQLVNILAFYLDVRLPTKLCYSDFCGHELKTPQFIRRVARLNSNVLHLCFSQNVNPNLLHPSHTLQNILHLLDTEVSDLGRQGPLEIDLLLTKFLEDQLTKDLECNEDSGSEDESDTLPYEWETSKTMNFYEDDSNDVGATSSRADSKACSQQNWENSFVTDIGAVKKLDFFVNYRKRKTARRHSSVVDAMTSGAELVSYWSTSDCDRTRPPDGPRSMESVFADTAVIRDWGAPDRTQVFFSNTAYAVCDSAHGLVEELDPVLASDMRTSSRPSSSKHHMLSWLNQKARRFFSSASLKAFNVGIF